jgi:endonuclease YncB( thermonuclease family)
MQGVERAGQILKQWGIASRSSFAKTKLIAKSSVEKFLGRQPLQVDTFLKVLDGDTLKLPNGQRVRLCGIDAPEVAKGNKPGQPLGEAAKEWLRSRIDAVGGKVIVSPVERDSPMGTLHERYGRLVAEVFVSARNPQRGEEEKLLNDELVRSGMAYHYRQYSQGCPSGADSLDEAEAEARGNDWGFGQGSLRSRGSFGRHGGRMKLEVGALGQNRLER